MILLFLTSCGIPAPSDQSIGVGHQAVFNGDPVGFAFHAVGRLITQRAGGSSLCTGTLVGDVVVLTAAHCIDRAHNYSFLLNQQSYPVKHVFIHPHYESKAATYPHVLNDVAIAILAVRPHSDITPLAMSRTQPWVDMPITIMGFGATGEGTGDDNVKRAQQSYISKVGAVHYEIPPLADQGNLCDGDSGGPSLAFVRGQPIIVGVHSTKDISGCGEGGNDARIDLFHNWVRQTARDAGGSVLAPIAFNAQEVEDGSAIAFANGAIDGQPVGDSFGTDQPLLLDSGQGCAIGYHESPWTLFWPYGIGLLLMLRGHRRRQQGQSSRYDRTVSKL